MKKLRSALLFASMQVACGYSAFSGDDAEPSIRQPRAAEDKPGAEALSGLARAFFYAGARSLIVSHWSVSDEATARLMIGTFRASALDPKLSHAEALRQSILAMIDAAKSDAEADPRLWAPFVVVGEPAKAQ